MRRIALLLVIGVSWLLLGVTAHADVYPPAPAPGPGVVPTAGPGAVPTAGPGAVVKAKPGAAVLDVTEVVVVRGVPVGPTEVLSRTGTDIIPLVVIAVGAVLAGVTLVTFTRKRRELLA